MNSQLPPALPRFPSNNCRWCGNLMMSPGWCSRRCEIEHHRQDPRDFLIQKEEQAKQAMGCGTELVLLLLTGGILWFFYWAFFSASKGY